LAADVLFDSLNAIECCDRWTVPIHAGFCRVSVR